VGTTVAIPLTDWLPVKLPPLAAVADAVHPVLLVELHCNVTA
jgi:hypothetical protein